MILLPTIIVLSATFAGFAQVAAGETYKLEQSVIAGGGGTSGDSAINTYSITGSIGQAIAGIGANNSTYKIQSGFFTAAPLAPTAATVSVGGRVTTATGGGITNILMSLTDSSGQVRTARTGAEGYYNFTDIPAGETYVITATGKRFSFSQPSQVVNINEDMREVNFVGNSDKRLRAF